MISTRIACEPQNDNYKRLAKYISDASHKGEKCLMCWVEGCADPEDFSLGILEVEDTQALNTRTKKEKTYHLIVSFRPEDEALLTSDHFKQIEKRFAEVLGFEEHQRHCGVHKNTNNLHMHVAYNMIHPETLSRHSPYYDFQKRDRLCRELEKELGLAVDNGKAKGAEPVRKNQKAAAYEAYSGQQSFEAYVLIHKKVLEQAVQSADGWQDVQCAFASIGAEIRLRGNGCVVANRHGKQVVKASSIGRGFSKGQLEKRFGAFVAFAPPTGGLEEVSCYRAKPLHRNPDRGGLYQEYSAGVARRKKLFAAQKDERETEMQQTIAAWRKRTQGIRADKKLIWKDKRYLLRVAKVEQLKAEEEVKAKYAAKRQAIKEEISYGSWNDFLQRKAEVGDEVALAILRSKKKEVQVQKGNLPRMEGQRDLQGVLYEVDGEGVVLYKLDGGGMVRDDGGKIYYTQGDEVAEKVARKLSRRTFGKGKSKLAR